MTDQLWEQAERHLCLAARGKPADLTVWEHSARVARIAASVARLPDAQSDSLNSEAIMVAALYHDIAWVLQCQLGQINREDLLLRPTTDHCRDMAADWITANLRSYVPGGVLERAAAAIRQSGDRRTNLLEARVLADADNLDQIGPPAIDRMIRKCRSEGKTLEHLLAAWQRQEEYHYWQARIKESFHFAPVRSLAERRYQALQRFMVDLAAAVGLKDLGQLTASHREQSAEPPSIASSSDKL
jgi:5'-deoxynucleotidase YfbR-like HD superfamily hydrolase